MKSEEKNLESISLENKISSKEQQADWWNGIFKVQKEYIYRYLDIYTQGKYFSKVQAEFICIRQISWNTQQNGHKKK